MPATRSRSTGIGPASGSVQPGWRPSRPGPATSWRSPTRRCDPLAAWRGLLHPAAVPLGDVRRSLSAALQVQLRKDRADVVLDRLVGQEYFGRYFLVGLTFGDEQQDALLLGRQLGEVVVSAAGRHAPDAVEHLLRH